MSLYWTFADIATITKRNLILYRRLPQLIVFSTIQPVMFLLLFTYVFGGAIASSSDEYINFLIPGILVQTMVFGAMMTGLGLAEDMHRGIIDRFRSLPMARSAVLAGRTISDLLRNLFVYGLMLGVGFLIGFELGTDIWHLLLGVLVALLMGFAFSWISATIGLLVKNPETAQSAGFIWVFPLVFASSVFVPVDGMPSWLQVFAKANPVTKTVDAMRPLMLGGEYGDPLVASVLWSVGILVVFIPLAVYAYKKNV